MLALTLQGFVQGTMCMRIPSSLVHIEQTVMVPGEMLCVQLGSSKH